MELELVRDTFTATSTGGRLSINGAFQCFTLELPDHRGDISEGRFRVVPYQSPNFGMRVPKLENVPSHTYIEIHPGNTTRATKGCILVGLDRQVDVVLRSRPAFAALLPLLERAWGRGEEVWLTIRSSAPPERAVA